jgi:hypothetical protein
MHRPSNCQTLCLHYCHVQRYIRTAAILEDRPCEEVEDRHSNVLWTSQTQRLSPRWRVRLEERLLCQRSDPSSVSRLVSFIVPARVVNGDPVVP